MEYFNRYMLKELGTFSGSFYYPNPLLSAGIDLSVFGFDDYRETMVRLSAAKSLNDRWALGVAFHYSFLQSTLLEQTQSRLSTDIGITFLPIDNLLIGMFVINLPSFSFGNDDIDVEDFDYYLAQISFQWEIINGLLITGSAGADSERTLIGNIGLEYAAFDSFFIRAGVQTSPLLPSIGLGYTLSGFTLDAAVVYHPVLGMSTGLGLSYTF